MAHIFRKIMIAVTNLQMEMQRLLNATVFRKPTKLVSFLVYVENVQVF